MSTSLNIIQEWKDRIENLLSGTESISQFCYKAMEERVKRLEARNERARIQMASKDQSILTPIIKEIIKEMKGKGEL